jgi:xanthine dehydrogenase YagT iron-sulfur-binding subunit
MTLHARPPRQARGDLSMTETAPPDSTLALDFTLSINGREHRVAAPPSTSLLDVLRDTLQLTGTKKGCDMGSCGACTVLVDGRRINACLALAVMQEGRAIATIEGLADGPALHPLQRAFIAHDALQCGYCTPGQIMSALGLIAEGRATDEASIAEHMSGNLCRCGAYPNIVAAIGDAVRG